MVMRARLGIVGWLSLAYCVRRVTRRRKPDSKPPRDPTPLAELVRSEISRADADLTQFRARSQGVLTVSGVLVTTLGAVLALSLGPDERPRLTPLAELCAWVGLGSFLAVALCVLAIQGPVKVGEPNAEHLEKYAERKWSARGWDQTTTKVLAAHLVGLRGARNRVSRWLTAAIFFQVVTIGCVAVFVGQILFASSR